MSLVAQAHWRRLDVAGTDAAMLHHEMDGYSLGTESRFVWEDAPCSLGVILSCDERWRFLKASITGRWRGRNLTAEIVRDGRDWTFNGEPQPQLVSLIDLDLQFTPATNIFPLRRMDPAIGETIEAPAAYLSFPDWTLTRLDQTYRRVDALTCDYHAPRFGFRTLLRFTENGFVADYPPLWREISPIS